MRLTDNCVQDLGVSNSKRNILFTINLTASMKLAQTLSIISSIFLGFAILNSCDTEQKSESENQDKKESQAIEVKVEAESYTKSSDEFKIIKADSTLSYMSSNAAGWIALDVNIPVAGRYKSQIHFSTENEGGINCWIEDYVDNKDGRTYNITSNISIHELSDKFITKSKDGTPLNTGLHKMKVHFDQKVNIDWISFNLIREHEETPKTLTQKTDGENWEIVWTDEFEEPALDTTKWTYDIGDWGWGNGELQYYTEGRTENARIEDGNLIIEARKDDMGKIWTSARLTTRGKVSFVYGKIEFRAKVPPYKGNWAAGWTLGDEYIDELDWPYCGEIDILESVGYEMDDITGNGIAHASAHSGAYYFKLGNQPTGVIEVENMNNEFHTYTVEWMPNEIKSYVDGRHYLTYNDTSTDLSWPFSKPQNIILNLAMGGGWGGYYGIDESATSQKMIIDYVRVYELR